MNNTFINKCIKGERNALDNLEICKQIKDSSLTNFYDKITPYCNDPETSTYNLAYCKKVRQTNYIKDIVFKLVVIIILGFICFGAYSLMKKFNYL
jgi:hypothetical protein